MVKQDYKPPPDLERYFEDRTSWRDFDDTSFEEYQKRHPNQVFNPEPPPDDPLHSRLLELGCGFLILIAVKATFIALLIALGA